MFYALTQYVYSTVGQINCLQFSVTTGNVILKICTQLLVCMFTHGCGCTCRTGCFCSGAKSLPLTTLYHSGLSPTRDVSGFLSLHVLAVCNLFSLSNLDNSDKCVALSDWVLFSFSKYVLGIRLLWKCSLAMCILAFMKYLF